MGKFYQFCLSQLAGVITRLPLNWQLKVGDFLGWLWFDVLRIRRDVVMSNLGRAFPQWSEAERVRVGRASVNNLGRGFVEFCRIPNIDNNSTYKFQIHGEEYLRAAKSKDKGVCILTCHMGNGDWGTVGLALNGIKIVIVSKLFKLDWLNDFWFSARRKLGTQFIPPRNSSFAILKALKKKESVAFALDQFMGPPIGVRTQFFGHETGTAMGLAIMAQRSGAPVVPIYTLREADGSTSVHIEPEIPFAEKETQEETIAYMTQIYTDKIEEFIVKNPDQWMWVHRRWKPFRD